MIQTLLLIELVLKTIVGSLLLLFPKTAARALGLPSASETFWPRMLGATFAGLAVATLLEGRGATHNGLGLSGQLALNLAGSLALVSLLILGRVGGARRGRVLLWLVAAALALLALVELAWV